MSVFTPVASETLRPWLAAFDAGELVSLTPIAEGVENTNYFVDTERGRFVLTLFERLDAAALPFYLGLMHTLAAHGVAAPDPHRDRQGRLFSPLLGKAAALVSRIAGQTLASPTPAHCAAIGDWLGRMHAVSAAITPAPANPRGASWRADIAAVLRPKLDGDDRALLDRCLQVFEANATWPPLPSGVVHADLFRDNVLWTDPAAATLAGVVDFYFAGVDRLSFDLAVAANDWCRAEDGVALDEQKTGALLAAYQCRRPLRAEERSFWPALLGQAAWRFWLSRLADRHLPRPGPLVKVKDPAEFRAVLVDRLRRFEIHGTAGAAR